MEKDFNQCQDFVGHQFKRNDKTFKLSEEANSLNYLILYDKTEN